MLYYELKNVQNLQENTSFSLYLYYILVVCYNVALVTFIVLQSGILYQYLKVDYRFLHFQIYAI